MSAAPQFPPVQIAPDPEGLTAACITAAKQLAQKAGGASSAAEAKDFAAGVLSLSQALAIQNPERDVNGVPLEHHEKLAKLSKPEPAEAAKKKRLRVTRDNSGAVSGAEEV